MKLDDYVCVFEEAMDVNACADLIKLFNSHEVQELQEKYNNNKKPKFTQFNFTAHKELAPKLHQYCVGVAENAIEAYRKNVPESEFWPEKVAFEQFRIKYYDPEQQDEFDTHIDAGNLPTSKRFLIFFWYLNDVEEGGETEFTNLNAKINPVTGRLLMFPPFWMFPHKGNKPISGPKYLLSSYLHFAE